MPLGQDSVQSQVQLILLIDSLPESLQEEFTETILSTNSSELYNAMSRLLTSLLHPLPIQVDSVLFSIQLPGTQEEQTGTDST